MKYIFQLSAIGVLLSLVGRMFYPEIANYIFAVCASGVAITKINTRYHGNNIRLKRLHRMDAFGGILLVPASFLMFRGMNEWMLCLVISAVLQLYAAFVIPTQKD